MLMASFPDNVLLAGLLCDIFQCFFVIPYIVFNELAGGERKIS